MAKDMELGQQQGPQGTAKIQTHSGSSTHSYVASYVGWSVKAPAVHGDGLNHTGAATVADDGDGFGRWD